MKTALSLVLVILSLAGIIDASYLSYEKLSNNIPPCSPGFQCETVLTSKYADIAGIPLPAYGLVFYIFVLIFASKHVLELDNPPKRFPAIDVLALATTFGFFFSLYLVFIMGIVLQVWCVYCLLSALTCLLLFITTRIYLHLYYPQSMQLWKSIVQWITHFLYVHLLKKILFRFSAESVHNAFTFFGEKVSQLAIGRFMLRSLWQYKDPKLATVQAGISFPNKIGLAAGFDYDGHLPDATASLGFGWHTIGTVTRRPYAGNTPPRLDRFPKSQALLVNKGLKSLGAKKIIARLSHRTFAIPVGISIASTNKHFISTKEQIMDILETFQLFEDAVMSHSYYELNISCPNTFGGEPFTTPERLEILLYALDKLELSRPVFVKMPIDQSKKETLSLLEVCDEHTIAGVIFGNLTKDKENLAVAPEERELWKKRKGNLSGKPTFERSLQLIKLTKKHFKNRFIIVGTGGIFTTQDAQQKLNAGADLLQMITGMIYEGPQQIGLINREFATN